MYTAFHRQVHAYLLIFEGGSQDIANPGGHIILPMHFPHFGGTSEKILQKI